MTESHNAPPKATFSNGAARPLHPQAQYPMASTGSSYIKSKWCHLSSWFICPYLRPRKSSKESSSLSRNCSHGAVRAIPRKTPVVCMTGKEMQDCKTMQHMQNPDAARLNHSLSDERLEKTRAMTRVTVHPSSMWLSQTVQLILWLVLSGWRRHNVLSVNHGKATIRGSRPQDQASKKQVVKMTRSGLKKQVQGSKKLVWNK